MIINKKKFTNLQVVKVRGKAQYMIVYRAQNSKDYFVLSTFFSEIKTEDLIEGGNIRFFEKTLSVRTYLESMVDGIRQDTYEVSWKKTPQVWRDFFQHAMQKEKWDLHFFGMKAIPAEESPTAISWPSM